jgi:hypothetical protein
MRTITRTATESSTGVFANIYTKTFGVKNGFLFTYCCIVIVVLKVKSVISLKGLCHEMNIFLRGL